MKWFKRFTVLGLAILCSLASASMTYEKSFGDLVTDLNFRDQTLNISDSRYLVRGFKSDGYQINNLMQLGLTKAVNLKLKIQVYEPALERHRQLTSEDIEISFRLINKIDNTGRLDVTKLGEHRIISQTKREMRVHNEELDLLLDLPILFDDIDTAYGDLILIGEIQVTNNRSQNGEYINPGYFAIDINLAKDNDQWGTSFILKGKDERSIYRGLRGYFNQPVNSGLQHPISNINEEIFNDSTENQYEKLIAPNTREVAYQVISNSMFQDYYSNPNQEDLLDNFCGYFYNSISRIRTKAQKSGLTGLVNFVGDQINRPVFTKCNRNADQYIKIIPLDFVIEIPEPHEISLIDGGSETFLMDGDYLVYRQTRIARETQYIWHNAVTVKSSLKVPILETFSAEAKTEFERTDSRRFMDANGETQFLSFRQRRSLFSERMTFQFEARTQKCFLLQRLFHPETDYQRLQVDEDKNNLRICMPSEMETITEDYFFVREAQSPDQFMVENPNLGNRLKKLIRGRKQYDQFVNLFRDSVQTIYLRERVPETDEFGAYLDELLERQGITNFQAFRDGQFPGTLEGSSSIN